MKTIEIRNVMNQLPRFKDCMYVYGEDDMKSLMRINNKDLGKCIGIYRSAITIEQNEQIELPYSSGLLMIQLSSVVHNIAIATLQGNNSGTIIIPYGLISFYKEVNGCICVLNTGINTKYVIINRTGKRSTVDVTFIR